MKKSRKYSKFSLTLKRSISQGKFRVLFGILHWKVLQILKNVNKIRILKLVLSKSRLQLRNVSLTILFSLYLKIKINQCVSNLRLYSHYFLILKPIQYHYKNLKLYPKIIYEIDNYDILSSFHLFNVISNSFQCYDTLTYIHMRLLL